MLIERLSVMERNCLVLSHEMKRLWPPQSSVGVVYA